MILRVPTDVALEEPGVSAGTAPARVIDPTVGVNSVLTCTLDTAPVSCSDPANVNKFPARAGAVTDSASCTVLGCMTVLCRFAMGALPVNRAEAAFGAIV